RAAAAGGGEPCGLIPVDPARYPGTLASPVCRLGRKGPGAPGATPEPLSAPWLTRYRAGAPAEGQTGATGPRRRGPRNAARTVLTGCPHLETCMRDPDASAPLLALGVLRPGAGASQADLEDALRAVDAAIAGGQTAASVLGALQRDLARGGDAPAPS